MNPPADSLRQHRGNLRCAGFTLVELLAAMAITAVILIIILGITQQTTTVWLRTSAKVDSFQGARAAFESMTRTLSQVTLNTYYDYYDSNGQQRTAANATSFVPAVYGRYSDLHFVSGKALIGPGQISHSIFFQLPSGYATGTYAGMDTLMNACGYFIAFDQGPAKPDFLKNLPNKPPDRHRYRLMQFLQPSLDLSVYSPNGTSPDSSQRNRWFTDPLDSDSPPVHQLAENIIALVILPKSSAVDSAAPLSPDFEYDSRGGVSKPQPTTQHQLPPLVEIIMIAIDEPSAKRLEHGSTPADFGIDLTSLFTLSDHLPEDLAALEQKLNERRIGYRIFRSTIPLRNAKWSS